METKNVNKKTLVVACRHPYLPICRMHSLEVRLRKQLECWEMEKSQVMAARPYMAETRQHPQRKKAQFRRVILQSLLFLLKILTTILTLCASYGTRLCTLRIPVLRWSQLASVKQASTFLNAVDGSFAIYTCHTLCILNKITVAPNIKKSRP